MVIRLCAVTNHVDKTWETPQRSKNPVNSQVVNWGTLSILRVTGIPKSWRRCRKGAIVAADVVSVALATSTSQPKSRLAKIRKCFPGALKKSPDTDSKAQVVEGSLPQSSDSCCRPRYCCWLDCMTWHGSQSRTVFTMFVSKSS